jgi:hypothetical protein
VSRRYQIAVLCILAGLAPGFAKAQHLHSSPRSHPFGKVEIGTSSTFSFQLSNNGSKLLKITSKSIKGTGFSMGSFPVPVKLSPGQSVQLSVTFRPKAKGHADGTITLGSSDPDSPLEIHLQGRGYYPDAAQLAVTPASLGFGNVNVGSSVTLSSTLTASGSAVTISSDQSTSSEFAILGLSLPVTIQAGQSLAVTIQFTPNASGTANAKVGYVSNAINSPTVEQVSGTGVSQQAHSVYLTWDPGDGSAVGYNIYRGTVSGGPYQEINTSLNASTNYTDSTVASGTTYYYVTTEVNNQGQESAYSNMVKVKIPTP